MAEIFKNIQGIHDNGEASVDIGINQDKITISRDNSDNSVAVKNDDDSLAKIKVSEVILNNEKISETYAKKQELIDGLGDKVDKVTGKGLSANDYTNEDKEKLGNIEPGAQKNTITGVKGDNESIYRTGNVNITKENIGLSNVDNTSDIDKPVSTAQATAIAEAKKAGTDAQGSIDSHAANVNNPHNVTAKQLGLDNVVNESKATMFTSPEFTGTPTAPTAASGTNNTQVATTAFVQAEIDKKIAAADAMIYKGTIGSSGATVTALPDTHSVGWSYKVATAGTYAGVKCEIGDMIVCIADGTAANNAHWSVIQSNIDGAVTGPASSVDSHVAVFDGATGKIIKDSGLTIGVSVPADAKFTDTTYSDVNASDSGLMTPVMLNKLNNISDSADAVSFAQTIGDGTELGTITINGTPYKIYAPASISGNAATATSATQATQDSKGQNIADTYIKGISANGQTITITFGDGDTTTITTQDTTYNNASSSSAGLMSAADFAKLQNIADGATANVGTITGVSINGTNIATGGVANIPVASTTVTGAVLLSAATDNDSATTAATSSAVKSAYDLANAKEDSSNKVTSITSESTDTQFPSAKAVYSLFESNKVSLTYEVVSETSDIVVS